MRQELSHYRILEKIGEGGMGEVYRAEDATLGRKVALKVLRPGLFSREEEIERLRSEARNLASLRHRNIVTVHSIEEADGVRFITMELLEGRPLSEVIPRHGLELDRLFSIAIPIADALAAAHEKGIVHRDLKPGNVVVSPEGEVKVLDFGLSERPDVTTEAGEADPEATTRSITTRRQLAGTLPYLSPEQVEFRRTDPRSDIFSLGVVLYEMATGHRPFQGGTPEAVISSILREKPLSITELRPALPNHLSRIVRLCLEKDPRRRFQSAGDVRNELQNLRAEIQAGPAPAPPPPRRRVAIGLAIGLAAALGALAVVWLLAGRDARPPPPFGLVAVLPFANLTGDPDQDYLAAGIGATLTQKLSEMRNLRLCSHSQVAAAARDDPSTQRLARELGVSMVVEGNVSRAPDPVEINLMLTVAESGVVAWSRSFQWPRAELPALQREIAQRLADALELPLSPHEQERLARTPTRSLEAYDLYLRGRQALERAGDARGPQIAAELFRQAIRSDPGFAVAHVGLSEALWTLYHGGGAPAVLEEAEAEARAAIELDAELPSAQVALARTYRSSGRYRTAIESVEGVLARHPHPAVAQLELAVNYEQVGDLDKARNSYQAAVALGPDDWTNWNNLGAFQIRLGEYAEAERSLLEARRLAPATVVKPRQNLGGLAILQGEFDRAILAFEEIPGPIRSASLASNMATAYYFSSRPDRLAKAEENYRLALQLDPGDAVVHGNLADLLMPQPGREEEAIGLYRQALEIVGRQLEARPGSPVTSFAQWRPLLLQRALYAAKARECSTAVRLATDLLAEIPETARDLHELAIVFALCAETVPALDALRRAVALGFSPDLIAREDEFHGLHDLDAFRELMAAERPQ